MKNILVVEDDIELLETLKLLFEEEGMTVFPASRISEAKLFVNTKETLVVLVDVNLPDGSGSRFASYIKDQSNVTKIILMSARDDVKDLARKIGVDYIEKPFLFTSLLNKITNH